MKLTEQILRFICDSILLFSNVRAREAICINEYGVDVKYEMYQNFT